MEIGNKLKVYEGGSEISLSSIQTKKKSGSSIITLKDPILEFKKEDDSTFTTYLSEAKRLVAFKSWIPSN